MSGLVAKFGSAEELVSALKRLREEGYERLDTFSPFPLPEAMRLVGGSTRSIGWIASLAGLAGGLLTYAMIYWTAVVDYPLNVGGRPLNSWPAFMPPVLVAAALWSGLGTLIGMIYLAGLPKWHHPLFDIHQFDRATYDKFFLFVAEDDPHFSEGTRALIESLGPEHVDRVAS